MFPPKRSPSATAGFRRTPDNDIRFSRIAGTAHWSPGELPTGMAPGISETASYSAPEIELPNDADQINTSLTYGFVFDYCGVEIDRDTGAIRIDKYVTMHDAGRILNPLIADGQIYGSFGWGVGCALLRRVRLWCGRQFLVRHLRRLSLPDRVRGPASRHPAHGEPVAAHPARRQRNWRRQLHEHAGVHRQRRRRRAGSEGCKDFR